MDYQQRQAGAPQQPLDEFAHASRRSEQEAIKAINAATPAAAAAHARLAVLHAARASSALGYRHPGQGLFSNAVIELRRAFPPIGPAGS